ncbi:MAG: DNA polymerase II [Acidobacteriota bacterium]
MAEHGFILQPTYRTVEGRAVVHLYGVLENGDSFLARDGRQAPAFWIGADDADRARQLGATISDDSTDDVRRTLDGRPAARVDLRLPRDAPPLRERLQQAGIRCYEADVRFATRFLIERGLRGAVTIDGDWRRGRGIARVYDDPVLTPSDWTPALSLLSIDIETSLDARQLLSIGLFGPGVAEVLLHVPDGADAPAGAVRFVRERDLLPALVRRVREIDPDILTGWNFIDFDLRVLDRMARESGVHLALGRGGGRLRLRPSRSPWSSWDATVPGRVVLDGIDLLRSAFVKMDSYSLGHVAREVLGEGKLIEGSDRGEKIQQAYAEDRQLLVDYNLLDARLVVDILDTLHVVDLAVERSKLTGLPIDRVAGSIAAFDFLYLGALRERQMVAPSVDGGLVGGHLEQDGEASSTVNLGGHVLEPIPGLYRNVLVYDFKSLYPSLMRTFGVDPLAFVRAHEPGLDDENVIEAPNGARFHRGEGILPGLLDDLFPRREQAKRDGDKVASHAIKILMNSFYGVLGTKACRFSDPAIAGAITAWGRDILLWTEARCAELGFRVLYGDTDSLFVLSGVSDPAAANTAGVELGRRLDADVGRYIAERWQVESRLELELEKLYLRLLLQEARGGGGGARKRYAGLIAPPNDVPLEAAEIEYVGLEVVRRDWTELAKRVQRMLYERLFREDDASESVCGALREAVDALRGGVHDEHLVYRKALRKDLDQYTTTTPPHVAAARKLDGKPPRVMRYVMTVAGPEPADERQNPLDHEHYVQKQIRPIAEPVLRHLHLDFDRAIGDDTQLSLF